MKERYLFEPVLLRIPALRKQQIFPKGTRVNVVNQTGPEEVMILVECGKLFYRGAVKESCLCLRVV